MIGSLAILIESEQEWSEVVDADLDFGENFIYNWGQATVGDSLFES